MHPSPNRTEVRAVHARPTGVSGSSPRHPLPRPLKRRHSFRADELPELLERQRRRIASFVGLITFPSGSEA